MKKIFLVVFVCLSMMTVYGQENGNIDAYGNTVRGPYETNRFGDNWFIDFSGGAGLYLGGQNSPFLGERINSVYNFTFGKMLTPSVGLRLGFNYYDRAKEYICNEELNFNYMNINAQVLWNLSNAIGGYKETRTYQFIGAFGCGYGRVFNANYFDGNSQQFTLNASIINKFRLSNRVDLNLEFSAAAIDHTFDKIATYGFEIDAPVSANLGITVRLGKTNFSRANCSEKVALAVASALKSKNEELENALNDNARLTSENESLKNQLNTPIIPVGASYYGDIPADGVIFFELGRSELNKKEKVHLETFAYYVKQVIASGKTITLIGSANKDAATAELNMKLSEDRVAYIKNKLVKKYGVDVSKIKTRADGDTNNIFGDPELDRCVYVRF